MANKLLTSLGVEEVEAEEIVPYAQLIDRYTAAGYDMKHTPLAQCRSHINMWELLNRITYFASHNPIWSTEDNRRSALMTESSKLLIRPRDIKRYIDVGGEEEQNPSSRRVGGVCCGIMLKSMIYLCLRHFGVMERKSE